MELRPEVSIVGKSKPSSGSGERSAGARSSPYRRVVADAGGAEDDAPEPDAGEEMDLGESSAVVAGDVSDVAVVDEAIGDDAGSDGASKPVGAEWIILDIERRHRPASL